MILFIQNPGKCKLIYVVTDVGSAVVWRWALRVVQGGQRERVWSRRKKLLGVTDVFTFLEKHKQAVNVYSAQLGAEPFSNIISFNS